MSFDQTNPLFKTHFRYLRLFYEYFYQRYSGRKEPNLKYKFTPSKLAIKFMTDFLFKIGEDKLTSIGPTFYFNYFSFQWLYWSNTEKIKQLAIMVDWVLDEKAYLRWKNRETDFDYFFIEFNQKFSIKKSEILKLVEIKDFDTSKKKKSSQGEDYNRQRYENGDERRLGYCFLTTTLNSTTSKICYDCVDKRDCKNLKKKIYPELIEDARKA